MIFIDSYFSDTQAYLKASYDYINGNKLTFDGVNEIEIQYKVTGMISVYPLLFGKQTNYAYYLLTPFIMHFLFSTLLTEYYVNKILKNNFKKINYVFLYAINLGLAIAIPFLGFFITSGNIFIQSSILFVFFIIFLDKQNFNDNIWLLGLIGYFYSFYSSTGIINYTFAMISFIICNLLFKNFDSSLKLLIVSLPIFSLFSIFLSFFVQNKILINNLMLGLYVTCIFICMCLLVIKYIFKHKIKNHENIFLLENKKVFIFNQAWIIINTILIITLFGFVYPNRFLYFSNLVFLSFFINAFLFIFNFYYFKHNLKQNKISILINLLNAIAICFILLSIIFQINNYSIWRIIYLIVGMGGPLDMLCLCIVVVINFINLVKNKKQYNIKLFNYKFINFKKCLLTFSTIVIISFISLSSGFIIANYTLNDIRFFRITSNAALNLTKITNNDYQLIKQIDNKQIKLFIDLQFYYLFEHSINTSNSFFNSIKTSNSTFNDPIVITNWVISSHGLNKAILFYNIKDFGNSIEEIDQNIAIKMEQLLNQNVFTSLVLDKSTSYYDNIINIFSNSVNNNTITHGENISIIRKK